MLERDRAEGSEPEPRCGDLPVEEEARVGTGDFQDETGDFRDETGDFRDEPGDFRDEAGDLRVGDLQVGDLRVGDLRERSLTGDLDRRCPDLAESR